MSVVQLSCVEKAYIQVIEDTIDEANNLKIQSSAVLEQLKQRWIEKLQDRLVNRSIYSQPMSINSLKQEKKNDSTRPLKIPEKSEINIVPIPSYNNNHDDLNVNYNLSKQPTLPISSTSPVLENKNLLNKSKEISDNKNDDDDDWDTAEWETVDPKSTNEMKETEKKKNEICKQKESNQISNIKKQTIHRRGEDGRGILVESQTELYDDEDIVDEESLSDLEDYEPDCTDLIVAQFDSVQRPHTRKGCQKGLWRIKLRHGIVQIDGKEIIFNTMAGDLSF